MQFAKSVTVLSGFALGLSLSSIAFASDTKPYVEIGPSWTDSGTLTDSTHVSGVVRAGIEVTPWAAFEVEGILGFGNGQETQPDGDEFEGGLDQQFGGYVRLGIPLDDKFLPYVRLGYATAQTTVTRTRTRDGETTIRETEDSFSGPSAGFGFQGFFGDSGQNGVRLDFSGLFAEGDNEDFLDIFDGTANISVTYIRRF